MVVEVRQFGPRNRKGLCTSTIATPSVLHQARPKRALRQQSSHAVREEKLLADCVVLKIHSGEVHSLQYYSEDFRHIRR